jgi:hypothetical protein
MKAISGLLEAGEAQRALRDIAVRQRGSASTYYLAMFGLMFGGALVGGLIAFGVNRTMDNQILDPGVTGPIGLVIGWLAYVTYCRRLIVRRFRRSMSDRELDVRFSHTLTIGDDALILESGLVRRVADWRAVTDLFKSRGYWIFLVEMEPGSRQSDSSSMNQRRSCSFAKR